MKKRIILTLGTLLTMFICALGFAACGSEHVHDWGEWTEDVAATCTAPGHRYRTCSGCDEREEETVDPVAHTYTKGWVEEVPATCIKEGLERNVCDVCGQGQERVIPVTDHKYGDWYDVKAASCSEEGLQRRDCIVCNPEASDEFAFETQSTEKLQHTPRAVDMVPANCLDPGREAGHECAVCRAVLDGMQPIEALGHKLGDPVRIKESTCTDHGIDRKTCERPGCEFYEDTTLELTDHVRVPYGENRDATCDAEGQVAGEKCDVCGHIFKNVQSTPKLDHILGPAVPFERGDGDYWHSFTCTRPGCYYSVVNRCAFELETTPATCTENEKHHHYCTECSNVRDHEVEKTALGHNYTAWYFDDEAFAGRVDGVPEGTRRHIRICSNAGHVASPEDPDIVLCTPVAGDKVKETCTTAGYTEYSCSECRNTYTGDRVEATGHSWTEGYQNKQVDGTWFHYQTCSSCGSEGEVHACTYLKPTTESATCDKPATTISVCDICAHEYRVEHGAALGHSYGNPKHDDTTTGENSRHYVECPRCGDRKYTACSMTSSTKVPTCQDPGEEIQICSVCKYTESEFLEAVQHKFDTVTPNANGSHTKHSRTCSVCHRVEFEFCSFMPKVIQPLSCSADEKTEYECPVCHDKYVMTTALKTGHVLQEYTSKDKAKHTGECIYCHAQIVENHDFCESNTCRFCGTDGLTYAYVSGSKTQAKLVATYVDGTRVKLNSSFIEVPEFVDVDGTGTMVPVVAVGTSAFFQNPYIREVVLPKTIQLIDYNAFDGCTNLRNVRIAGHNFGDADVQDCALTRIESSAFRNCSSLEQAILPATLVYIGPYAFENCTSLAEINLPKSITEIQDYAFRNTAYYNAPENWEPSGVLYIGPHLIRARENLAGDYTVTAGTVSISTDAFKDCKQLTRITLPAELKACDKDAFLNCEGLTTVIFEGTFAQYLNIRFDNDAASPMHYAKELTIKGAEGTPQLPATAGTIPAGAFRGSKIESIVIPASVTSIGAMAFADCPLLTSIKFARNSLLQSVGEDVVKNTPFYNDPDNWDDGVLYIKDEKDRPIALVAADMSRAQDYVKLESEQSLADGYKQVIVPEGCRAIAPRAFAGMTELRLLEIADSVNSLGAGIVSGCKGLDRVDFRGTDYGWFCNSATIARSQSDRDIYGGDNHDNYYNQRKAADLFDFYTGVWRRGNY